MQSLYLQRIMKKNADRGYEKTKPKQSQFQSPAAPAKQCKKKGLGLFLYVPPETARTDDEKTLREVGRRLTFRKDALGRQGTYKL